MFDFCCRLASNQPLFMPRAIRLIFVPLMWEDVIWAFLVEK